MSGTVSASLRLCCVSLILVLSFWPVTSHEHDESMPSEEESAATLQSEGIPDFVEGEEPRFLKRQFKTAEMADAVMGSETPIDPFDMESLYPMKVKDFQSGFSPPCDDGADCLTAGAEDGDSETSQQVALEMVHAHGAEEKNAEATKTFKVNCEQKNISSVEALSVNVLNASQDLMEFLNVNGSECSMVLFFTAWCQFSAGLAPHFNALPRVFPAVRFLALDASQHSSLSTRFGTVAVPNILLFQGAKPMARFNHTERTLETLASFITNQTGLEAGPERNVTDADRLGPLAGVPVKGVDWLLVFSVLFIAGFTTYGILRTDGIRWLIPGHEHEHQD
ncbi:thioredoxin domain-containing protein 15 [Syngnathus scovelli]|uniref:thioredoxin domain-containing protein 15 n=1 Tax=Syngnathus scovelli TaxID=161590 RepID=UPI0021101F78|nr:thioredoxin domain-containing protein 15 [Syngnathus scovelli]